MWQLGVHVVFTSDGWMQLHGIPFIIGWDFVVALLHLKGMELGAGVWKWHYQNDIKKRWAAPAWFPKVIELLLSGLLIALQVWLSVNMYKVWGGFFDAVQLVVQLGLGMGLHIVASEVAGYVGAKCAEPAALRRFTPTT